MDNKEGTLQFCITSLWHLATTHLSLVYEHWNVLDVLKNRKKDAIQGQIHNPKHLSSVTLEQLDLAIFGIFNQNSTRKRSSLSSQY